MGRTFVMGDPQGLRSQASLRLADLILIDGELRRVSAGEVALLTLARVNYR